MKTALWCEFSVTPESWLLALANLFLSLLLLLATLYLIRLRRTSAAKLVGPRPSRVLLLFIGLIAAAAVLLLDLGLSRLGTWGEVAFRVTVVVTALLLIGLYRRVRKISQPPTEREPDESQRCLNSQYGYACG